MTVMNLLGSASGSSSPGKSIPLLIITHGLHQGVSLALDKATYIIGSDGNADLLLGDAGIAERHMVLRFSRGRVVVEAIGGEVLIIGRNASKILIPPGSGHRAVLPLAIRVGEARLVLNDTCDKSEPAECTVFASLPIPRWAIALLLTFVCAGVFALRGQPMSRLELMTRNQLAASPNAQYPDVTTAEAALWLKQQLAAVRLNQIKVNESDGQLHLQGRYEPAQKSLWVHVQQAFDRRFGQQLVLRADVVPSAEIAKPRVRFQAVWFGAHPYVVNESGKRLYPGASLADDWTLERIENNEVILARGEERFTFTL